MSWLVFSLCSTRLRTQSTGFPLQTLSNSVTANCSGPAFFLCFTVFRYNRVNLWTRSTNRGKNLIIITKFFLTAFNRTFKMHHHAKNSCVKRKCQRIKSSQCVTNFLLKFDLFYFVRVLPSRADINISIEFEIWKLLKKLIQYEM